jgi:hypothetical protein
MIDQNSLEDNESKQEKWNRGLDIFIESVINQIILFVNVLVIKNVITN